MRRHRERCGYSQTQLADLVDLDARTIRRLETEPHIRTSDASIARLATALKCPTRELGYPDREAEAGRNDTVFQSALDRGIRPPPVDPPEPNLVRTGPDPRYAQRESMLGLDQATIELAGETYPLIGFAHMLELQLQYGRMRGPFVVAGLVREVQEIPSEAAFLLNAQQGLGATYARIRRDVPSLGPNRRDVPFETTVYAPKGAHGTLLHACFKRRVEVKVVVKLVVRPQTETRRLFPTLSDPVVLRPWALVATGVYTDKG